MSGSLHWEHSGLGNRVKCNFVDISDDSLADVHESLASVLDSEIKCWVVKSGYFEFTADVTIRKKLAVCVQYLLVENWLQNF